MKTIKKYIVAIAIAVTTLISISVNADTFITNNETLLTTATSSMGTGCPGSYSGYLKFTNSTGTFAIRPPTNTVSGVFSCVDVQSPVPRASVVVGLTVHCDTNTVAFPATNSKTYSCIIYRKDMPTNGQPANVQLVWRTIP